MANPNTRARALFAPVTTFQGASSTSEIQAQDSAGNTVYVKIPANFWKDRRGALRISGQCTAGSGNLTLKVYDGDKSGTLLATTGAIAFGTGSFAVSLDDLVSDSVTKKLNGLIRGHLGGVVVAQAAISNGTFDPTIAHSISVSLTCSASNAGNGVQLRNLEAEAL